MPNVRTMQRVAQWHIWLGWLIGVPLVLWTLSGLAMVARPIEEVRGEHLRRAAPDAVLPRGFDTGAAFAARDLAGVTRYSVTMRGETPVAEVEFADGRTALFDARNGAPLPPMDEGEARRIAGEALTGDPRAGDARILSARRYAADAVPLDFRRPMPVWRIVRADGTYVYVGAETRRVEAIRTRWWRFYDLMWGLHIMDLRGREDSHNPFVIVFGLLALISAVFGCVLMFRRRRRRIRAVAVS